MNIEEVVTGVEIVVGNGGVIEVKTATVVTNIKKETGMIIMVDILLQKKTVSVNLLALM